MKNKINEFKEGYRQIGEDIRTHNTIRFGFPNYFILVQIAIAGALGYINKNEANSIIAPKILMILLSALAAVFSIIMIFLDLRHRKIIYNLMDIGRFFEKDKKNSLYSRRLAHKKVSKITQVGTLGILYGLTGIIWLFLLIKLVFCI